eukprot:1153782-Pelagomonas_calceolata.AAC.11
MPGNAQFYGGFPGTQDLALSNSFATSTFVAAPPAGDFEEGAALELRVAEQRLTNLIQSLCVVASLAAVHVLQLIPTAVVGTSMFS